MSSKKAKQLFRIFLLAGTLISLYFVPWKIVFTWIQPLPTTVQQQVDKAHAYGFDGIIVYVDQKNKTPQFFTSGYKNKETKTPADPTTLFKIASIGKLYDALAITKLVGTQRISLDDTVADHFPELIGRIENAEKITVRMLVKHRSGIFNLTETHDFWNNPPKNSEEALARILDIPANFAPDTDYEYSNSNYLLLTLLIEKVTGMSKFEYIKQVILDPLQLQHTFGSIHEIDMKQLMSGYYVGIDEDIKTSDYASMNATAEDVAIFIRALNDGSIFNHNEQAIYTSIYKYEHTGLIPGYQSIAKYHKDIDTVIIQFTNTTDFQGYHWNLSEVMYGRIVKIVRKNTKS